MQWVDQLKEGLPDYAKDTRLNIDAVVKRSTLAAEEAEAVALAAVFATGNTKLWTWIQSQIADQQVCQHFRRRPHPAVCAAGAG